MQQTPWPIQPPSPYSGPARVYREEEQVVFVGEGDWSYLVPLEQVASDEALNRLGEVLRGQPWMSQALYEQFCSEVAWLRMQLPPGK